MFCKSFVLCLFIICCWCDNIEFKMSNISRQDDDIFKLHGEGRVSMKNQSLKVLDRPKRQLLYPIATLLQITFGVATPVTLPYNPFFVNQAFQTNFRLPYRISEIPWSFLGTPAVIDQVRSRNKRDEVPLSNELPTDTPTDENGGITSEQLYFLIENLLESYGYNGTGCLLHSVCQLARIPFQEDEDLLHEIVHFLLSPSQHDLPHITNASLNSSDTSIPRKSPELDKKYAFNERITPFQLFMDAEHYGKLDMDCNEVFEFCPKSPLDFISEISYEDENEIDSSEIINSLHDPYK